tara:strand:- start:243 stop:518 length:276 start_codon:yes stop_codon:yes gene_type:complete
MDIEFTGITPEMLCRPRMTPLVDPAPSGSLADDIARAMDIPELWPRVTAMLPLITRVRRMERALDQIVEDAMADRHAVREAGNVVPFRRTK